MKNKKDALEKQEENISKQELGFVIIELILSASLVIAIFTHVYWWIIPMFT